MTEEWLADSIVPAYFMRLILYDRDMKIQLMFTGGTKAFVTDTANTPEQAQMKKYQMRLKRGTIFFMNCGRGAASVYCIQSRDIKNKQLAGCLPYDWMNL